ncbi:MAG: hypothetical protein ABH826_00525 [Patescibacteria group bacterium]
MHNFMKLKPKNLIILGAALLLVIGLYLWINNKTSEIDESKISVSSTIDYPSEFNYRQTVNDCGPFNVAAVVRALSENEVSSAEFAKNIEWRLPNKYTLPWGMEEQLKENGISVEIPNVKALSDEEKITFLQERLSQGNPIIILGERDNYEHYITIFGFNSAENKFYAYDSLFEKGEESFTIDNNDSLPGNRNLTSEELLDFWRGGGMYGLYNWYAIVASKE